MMLKGKKAAKAKFLKIANINLLASNFVVSCNTF